MTWHFPLEAHSFFPRMKPVFPGAVTCIDLSLRRPQVWGGIRPGDIHAALKGQRWVSISLALPPLWDTKPFPLTTLGGKDPVAPTQPSPNVVLAQGKHPSSHQCWAPRAAPLRRVWAEGLRGLALCALWVPWGEDVFTPCWSKHFPTWSLWGRDATVYVALVTWSLGTWAAVTPSEGLYLGNTI